MAPDVPDDPFALPSGQTFIRPTPGGRTVAGRQPAPERAVDAAADLAPCDHGLNPLLALANRLLLAVPQMRSTHHLAQPAELRNTLAHGVRQFAHDAAAAGIPTEQITAARYVLCTVLDEAASDTPWGGSGVWGQHSLLVMFHNEAYGGEKVFRLMAKLAEEPARHIDLLELIYAALALGFEGRYRIIENGAVQLEAVRDRLAQIVRQQRGTHPKALAEHWQVPPQAPRRAGSWLPLLAVASVCGLLLLGWHLWLSASLGRLSDPVFAQIQGLRPMGLAAAAVPVAERPAAAQPRLAHLLAADIKAGFVVVRDEVDRSVVTIKGDGLFDPGSTTLVSDREALMARIGDALARLPGPVLVTGHTDNQPIRSARFPSNWHLSEARAKAVGDMIVARGVAAARVRAEGRAEAEPVAANDTPGNRAQNRRVEVTLMVQGAAPAVPAAPAAPATPAAAGSATS